MEQLIFNYSKNGKTGVALPPVRLDMKSAEKILPPDLLRGNDPDLPEVSEPEVVRHFVNLSRMNHHVDRDMYPLGSCTMKYNPRAAKAIASMPGYFYLHPMADVANMQGHLENLYELQNDIATLTGMSGVSLTPMAGAQGEFAGVAMIAQYHRDRGDFERTEMLIPDAAHGTNPASARMCEFTVKEIPTCIKTGDIDLDALEKAVGPKTAGIMLTNPSTLGVFERKIKKIAQIVHKAGGLLYYDGANLNAILGRVRPGDMGFDVMHLNLHKTFATPHGGGGPGSGPVAVNDRLKPYLPVPMVGKNEHGYFWLTKKECPKSIGRLSCFMGNSGVLLRAHTYTKLLGKNGAKRVGQFAALNANYLMKKLEAIGYTLAFPQRRASHEFIVTVKPLMQKTGISALDIAKRLLDYGIYAPTIYFPQLISECLLIEPTETESKKTVDRFVEVMKLIYDEAHSDAEKLKGAPYTTSVGRLDEVRAARELIIRD
jgi:glycine dehydrogenase subunit 2